MSRTMLQQVIDQAVANSLTQSIARTADGLAEALAKELLSDPQVKAELLAAVRDAFHATWRALQAEAPEGGAR